jgi:4'-phosphopantetheinyl transferase EntD
MDALGDGFLDGLFPEGVSIAVSGIEDHVAELHPEERVLIKTAVAKRQHEFSTGRALARPLLAAAGHPDFSILREEDRIPIWPADIVGSISHTEGLCAAVIARRSDFAGLGLDLEPDADVDRDIARVVCRDAEHEWVRAEGTAEYGRRCRIVFSVKEAVYKAFYPRTRVFWSFQDVGVEIDLEAGTFEAELPESADRDRAEGRILQRDGFILSGVAVPA